MNFLKNFVVTLILCCIFLMCGVGLFFDPKKLFVAAVVAFALLAAAVISALTARDEKIKQLEEKINHLEGKA